jgi:TolB-like protein
MKKTLLIFTLVLSVIARAEQQPAPLSAAVLDFQTSGEKLTGKGAEAAVLLNARLSATANLILVERQEIDKLLGEQELGISGTVTAESAAKIGRMTGAKVLITGRLFEAGDKIFLVAKIISTETSRVYGETATLNSIGTLDKAVDELAPKIAAVIEKRADTLLAKVEEPAARLERWKTLIAGKKLPSVSVKIAEQHIGRQVSDPAAETEVKLALQQLGFEVIDLKESRQQPSIAITGEGFSETATRRGNLVSCRSRVEIKVIQAGDGKLLLADRQTDVAIDVAENIAAKAALQNAAIKLLDRILPKLVAE